MSFFFLLFSFPFNVMFDFLISSLPPLHYYVGIHHQRVTMYIILRIAKNTQVQERKNERTSNDRGRRSMRYLVLVFCRRSTPYGAQISMFFFSNFQKYSVGQIACSETLVLLNNTEIIKSRRKGIFFNKTLHKMEL